VGFLAIFVKLALQTNKKNEFEEPAVSALRAFTATSSNFTLQNNKKYTFSYFNNSPF
jgi:hypothetical protein